MIDNVKIEPLGQISKCFGHFSKIFKKVKTVGDILENIKLGELSVAKLSKETGISAAKMYKWKGRGTKLTAEDAEKLQNWLDNFPREKGERENDYIRKRRELKNNDHKGIPIYESAPDTLSNSPSIRDEKQIDPDFWVTIPNLRDCNYGARAKGDSMYPLIRTNALVIGKEIFDFRVIVFGEIYIIKTVNGLETVKYIQPDDKDKEVIWLVPYNTKANKTPIHKSEILRLFEAKAVFNTI